MISSRFSGAATGSLHARQALAENIDRSVVIGVHFVAAMQAGERRLVLTRSLVDRATCRAGLRRIGGVRFHQRPAALLQFVGKHRFDHVPANVEDGSVEAALALTAGSHAARIQRLDHHSPELSRDRGCRFVLPVTPNARCRGFELGNGAPLLGVTRRAPLAARKIYVGVFRELADAEVAVKERRAALGFSERHGNIGPDFDSWRASDQAHPTKP